MAEETTDTSQQNAESQQQQGVETQVDNAEQNQNGNWADDVVPTVVGRDGEVIGESVSGEENNNSENTEENTDTGADTNDEQVTIPEELTLKVNGKEEKFSLKDKKQLEKIVEFAQKGRYTEQIQTAKKEYEEQQKLVGEQLDKLTYAYLMNVNRGEVVIEEPKRKDYFDEDGKYYHTFNSDDEAKKAYEKATENYEATVRSAKKFAVRAQESYQQYQKTMSEFQKEHPEIEDFKQFMKDHVNPMVKPLLSFGAEPLPKELLEAVYFYKYKDKIIQKAIENDRKGLKDDKPIFKTGKKVVTPEQPKGWGDVPQGTKIVFR